MICPGLIALFGLSADWIPTEGRLYPAASKVLPSHEDLSSALAPLHSPPLSDWFSWKQKEEEAQVQGGDTEADVH